MITLATAAGIVAGAIAIGLAGYVLSRRRTGPAAIAVAVGLVLLGAANLLLGLAERTASGPALAALAATFGATAVVGRSLEDVDEGD